MPRRDSSHSSVGSQSDNDKPDEGCELKTKRRHRLSHSSTESHNSSKSTPKVECNVKPKRRCPVKPTPGCNDKPTPRRFRFTNNDVTTPQKGDVLVIDDNCGHVAATDNLKIRTLSVNGIDAKITIGDVDVGKSIKHLARDIETERSDRIAADALEKEARIKADEALHKKIDKIVPSNGCSEDYSHRIAKLSNKVLSPITGNDALTAAVSDLNKDLSQYKTELTSLQANLNGEAASRSTADNQLQVQLTSQQTSINTLITDTVANTKDVTSNAATISSEIRRAISVEGNLLNLETTAAGDLVSAINQVLNLGKTEVSRASSVETVLSREISAEITRARSVETVLSNAISSTILSDTSLSAEINRAKSVEAVLSTEISTAVGLSRSIEGVLTNLKTNDQGNLVGAINDVFDKVTIETSRAISVETSLDTSARNMALDISFIKAKLEYCEDNSDSDADIEEAVKTLSSKIGNLTSLSTNTKASTVVAINEVVLAQTSAEIAMGDIITYTENTQTGVLPNATANSTNIEKVLLYILDKISGL